MLLIRDIMYCRPGKVRPMVQKALAMAKLMEKSGLGPMRVTTDLSAERFWTMVMEFETPSLQVFEEVMAGKGMSEADTKAFEKIMEGYHDLVEGGRREIFKVEA